MLVAQRQADERTAEQVRNAGTMTDLVVLTKSWRRLYVVSRGLTPVFCYPRHGSRFSALSNSTRPCTGSPCDTITRSNGNSSIAPSAGSARS
jgi:hypothetical protein